MTVGRFAAPKRAISEVIFQVMRKHPTLISLGWRIILGIYRLPIVTELVAIGSNLTITVNTTLGLFRFRPVFMNEVMMALGLYEPHTREAFLPRKGQTVLDIGANIGFYTLNASRLVGPTGKVIGIEANPETYRVLETNVLENCSTNTTVLCCAAGAEQGYSDLYLPSNYAAGSTIVGNQAKPLKPIARVPVRTVDSLVSMLGLKNVDWIKIDVEGAEPGVLAGSKNVMRDLKPKIVIETMDRGVIAFLRESGYYVTPLRGDIGLFYAFSKLPSRENDSTETIQQTLRS